MGNDVAVQAVWATPADIHEPATLGLLTAGLLSLLFWSRRRCGLQSQWRAIGLPVVSTAKPGEPLKAQTVQA